MADYIEFKNGRLGASATAGDNHHNILKEDYSVPFDHPLIHCANGAQASGFTADPAQLAALGFTPREINGVLDHNRNHPADNPSSIWNWQFWAHKNELSMHGHTRFEYSDIESPMQTSCRHAAEHAHGKPLPRPINRNGR